MLTKLTIALLLTFSTFAGEICSSGKIKYTFKQKEKIESVQLCESSDKYGEMIYSKNCKGLKCKILKEPFKRPVNLKKYAQAIGSPGFKVCRELKGSPQIIKYQINKSEWKQDSRCIFNKSTFVSINVLMEIWKDFILY